MKKKSKVIKIVIILLVIILIVIGVIFVIKTNLYNNDETISDETGRVWKRKEVLLDKTVNTDIGFIPKWDERLITQKFYSVEYMNNEYWTSRDVKTTSDKIGKKLGTTTASGYDENTDKNYTINLTMYELKDFPIECIIAVQFEGDSDYYIYANTSYRPKTLGNLIDDLNLKEIADFGTVNYNYSYTDSNGETQYAEVEFYDVDNEIIWNMLLDKTKLQNIYDLRERYTSDHSTQSVSIEVKIPMLGIQNSRISLTDKGYLLINIFDTGKGFYIGEKKIQDFIDYISNNYDGYRIVYVDENGEETNLLNELSTDENKDDGKIMVTQNTLNGVISEEFNMNEILNDTANFITPGSSSIN